MAEKNKSIKDLGSFLTIKSRPAQVKEKATEPINPICTDLADKFENHALKGEPLTTRSVWFAWYHGHQEMRISRKEKDKLVENKKGTGGIRYRSRGNILKRNGRDAVSMLVKENPMGICIPMDTTQGSRLAARTGSHILKNAYDRVDLEIFNHLAMAAELAYIMGTGWIKCPWDPNAFFYNPKTKIWDQTGDIKISTHDDFEIFPDDTAKSWGEVKWIMHVYMQDIKELERLYPKYKESIEEWTGNNPSDHRNVYKPSVYYEKNKGKKGQAIVAEYYSRPQIGLNKIKSKDLAEKTEEEKRKYFGERYVCVNWKHLIKEGINPYHKFGYYLCLPFVPIFWFRSPDKLHGHSPLKEQLPRQYEYTRFNSLIGENAFFTAIPRMSVMKGSGLKPRRIDDDPRSIIETTDGRIYVAQPPNIPAYVIGQRDFVLQESMRDANTGPMAYGEVPSGTPGVAIRQIMSRQLGRYAPEAENLKNSTKMLNLLILNHYRYFATEKRFLNILGDKKKFQIEGFRGVDLQGSFDIIMPITSAYRNSPAARTETAMNLWDRQIFQLAQMGDPAAQKIVQVIEFGNIDEPFEKQQRHREKAEWVVKMILSRKGVPDVYPWDNHFIHLEVLEDVTLDPKFEDREDDIKSAIIGRMNLHVQFLNEAKAKMEGEEEVPAEQNTEQGIENMRGGPGVSVPGIAAQG